MELMIFCPFAAFFSIFVLLIIGLIAYGIQQNQTRNKHWQVFASRSGLTFEAGGLGKAMQISGVYFGYQVVLDTFSHHIGYSPGRSYYYTRVKVFLVKEAIIDLKIQEKHTFLIHKGDTLKTGDEQIDRRFSISGRSGELAQSIFINFDLRQRILQARSFNIEISGQCLTFTQPGIEKDVDYLTYLLDLLCDLASFADQTPG